MDTVKQKKTNSIVAALGGASDTLKILEKFILKEGGPKWENKGGIDLEPSRLPLLKREWKRERVHANYDLKFKWEPSRRDSLKHTARVHKRWFEKQEISGWDH